MIDILVSVCLQLIGIDICPNDCGLCARSSSLTNILFFLAVWPFTSSHISVLHPSSPLKSFFLSQQNRIISFLNRCSESGYLMSCLLEPRQAASLCFGASWIYFVPEYSPLCSTFIFILFIHSTIFSLKRNSIKWSQNEEWKPLIFSSWRKEVLIRKD